MSLVVTLLCCLVPLAAVAQTVNVTSGSINGRVMDSSGGVLPGVSVTATSLDTGLKRTVVSEKDGAYVINLLPPGLYRVDAELSGLGKASVGNLTVLLGNSTRADLKIAPQVTETVTVTAPTVDASRTGTAVSVTSEQIANLPLLGRDFRALASLTPGIVDAFGGRITANGARGLATDYNIDGASSNNDFFGENTGGTRAPFTFSQAAIREFQVVRSQYDAEYGRGVGAQINAITKSGTNDLHGEGFIFRRDRQWATRRNAFLGTCAFDATTGLPIFNDPANPTCRSIVDSFRAKDSTQGGGAIGGPIVKNQVFFFANFDSQRQKLPITVTDARIASGAPFLALTPTVQQQFLDKIQALVGHPYGSELAYDQTFNQNTYLGKVDLNFGAKTRLSIRDNYTNFENAYNQPTTNLSNQGIEHDKFNQLVGQMTTVVSSRLVNEALVEFATDERPITPTSSSTEISVSNVASTGASLFGQLDSLPNNTKERKLQVKDTLRFQRGNHSLKIGGEALFNHIDNLFARNRFGVFVYNNIANFVADTPNSYRQGYGDGGGLTSWEQNTYAFYLSDNYRATPRLSVDYGVRYDWQTMPKPAVNVFPQHPEFLANIHNDMNNLAPRGGFAYDLSGNGKSVLRGGAGLFYGYMPSILLSNPLTQISGNFLQATITCTAPGVVPCPTYPNVLTGTQFALLGSTAGTDIVTVAEDYQAQQAFRSSLQYERQLARGYSAAVSVIYSKMGRVQGSRNVNAVSSGVSLGNMPVYNLGTNAPTRRYTDMGVVRELCSCEQASYRALTIETHRMISSKIMPSWDLSYTFGSSIDQDTNERSTSTSFLLDPLNPKLGEGPSDNDVRHRFVGSATYKMPYGVQASAIFQVRSGIPYNGGIGFTGVGVTGAPNSLNGLSSMTGSIPVFVNGSGAIIDLLQANNMTLTQFSAFLQAQNARLIGRNAFRQPNWHSLDLRLSKTFDIPGARHTQVQLIGEGFNLLATKNQFVGTGNQNMFQATLTQASGLYTFVSRVGPTGFGVTNSYSSTPDPRQAQVAVKFIF
jgi:hypothetical protein